MKFVKVDENLLKTSPSIRATAQQLMRSIMRICDALGYGFYYHEILETCKIVGYAKRLDGSETYEDSMSTPEAGTDDDFGVEYELQFQSSPFWATLVRDTLQFVCRTQGLAIPGERPEISPDELKAELLQVDEPEVATSEPARAVIAHGKFGSDPAPRDLGTVRAAMNYHPQPETESSATEIKAAQAAEMVGKEDSGIDVRPATEQRSKQVQSAEVKPAPKPKKKRRRERSGEGPIQITDRWIAQFAERIDKVGGSLEKEPGGIVYYRNRQWSDRMAYNPDKFQNGVGHFRLPEEADEFKKAVRHDEDLWAHY